MGTISIINPSPGTDFSEPVEVFIDVEKNAALYSPAEMLNVTSGSGSHTYKVQLTVGTPTIYGFSLFAESDLVNIEFSFWSTDNLLADINDDADWVEITAVVAGNLISPASEIDAVYPVITGLESKKLRVKCIITGGTDHTILVNSLSLV